MATRWASAANAAWWAGALAMAATCAMALHSAAAQGTASKVKAGKPDAQAVKVTPEMIGAGIVSSGVDLLPIPPVSGSREKPVASWGKPLPYPIVIADRRNNRLIEVAPDKRIVWEFPSPNLKIYRGNDDVFFSPDGRQLVVNEEDNYDIHIVDYDKRSLTWTYGASDTKGSAPGYLNYPDDAHLMADGKIVTADIRNCRVLFIDPRTSTLIGQWGKEGTCKHDPPRFLAYPNGSTPLDNGDILVTEITGAWITRITREGKVVWSARAPRVRYPSDAFPTRDGQVIVADYSKPGKIVIFDPKNGKASWEYSVASGEKMLDHPSLALELPTGDVVVNDDLRHRVLVIDRASKEIVWQYGVTDTPGHAPGYLFYPDGMDIDVFRDWKATPSRRDAPATAK
ncbi:MAG: outer membrane protein assembly factor BamB family protein [Usitatibacter sp.]